MAPEVIGKTAGHAYQSSNTSSGYCAAPVGGDGNYDGRTIDMWSCGVVLYVCTYGVYPFEDVDRPEDNKRTWFNITHGKYALPEFVEREVVASAGQIKCVNVPVSASLRSLISDLLVVDPGRRPSAAEVLEHPFLASGGHAFPQSSSAADSAKLDNASGGLHQYDLQDWGSAGDLFSNMPSIAPPLFDYDMTTMMS